MKVTDLLIFIFCSIVNYSILLFVKINGNPQQIGNKYILGKRQKIEHALILIFKNIIFENFLKKY